MFNNTEKKIKEDIDEVFKNIPLPFSGTDEELGPACFLFRGAAAFFLFYEKGRWISSSPSSASLALAMARSFIHS